MSTPLASCLCPTAGRFPGSAWLVREAVESFCRQDYPNRELVVLNDAPGQELECLAPGVRVVNVGVRYPSLGDKYNALVALARGDVLLPWEDDDLSLPHRVAQAVAALAAGAGYFNPQRSWFWVGGVPRADHAHGVCHNASAYTRAAFAAAGGYPAASGPQDALMDARLKAAVPAAAPLPDDPAAWSYVYRWGVSPQHLSGQADPEAAWGAWGRRPAHAGRFLVHPAWRDDYASLCRAAAKE